MIDRLLTSLQSLAASADVQLARHADSRAMHEVALDFADALLLVSDCPQVVLTDVQRRRLAAVEAELDTIEQMGGDPWSASAVRSAAWADVRSAAEEALREIGIEPSGIS